MKMTKLASRNPARSYIGPLEPVLGVRVAARKIPSEAWQKEHPPGVPCEPPTEADMVVQVVVLGSFREPSALLPPTQWPIGEFPVVELAAPVPFATWCEAGRMAIRRARGENVDGVEVAPLPDASMEPLTPGEPQDTMPAEPEPDGAA